MHQCAEIYLPRKKKVRDNFHSNTFRIFDEKIPERLDPDKVYETHSYSTRDPEEYDLNKTHNIPQTYHAKFIRTNVRFLNAPISHMETERTMTEQGKWWSNVIEPDVKVQAPYSVDSTQRNDYQAVQGTQPAPLRHRRNNNSMAASGIIPTLSPPGSPKVFLEHMSFIQQYDSRRSPDQPYQGNCHGAFVWREMRPRVLGGGKVTSAQLPPPRPPAGACPGARGPGVSASFQGRHGQLLRSPNPPTAPREQLCVQGGVQGVSTASDREERSLHVDAKGTV